MVLFHVFKTKVLFLLVFYVKDTEGFTHVGFQIIETTAQLPGIRCET